MIKNPTIQQTIIVAKIIPSPIKTLNNGLLVDFIAIKEQNPKNPLIPPPIAPPTIGIIEHNSGLFPHINTIINPATARAYSYHVAEEVN